MTLTGLGAAMARGHMAADGVICGTGTYTVILAADGLPLFDSGGDPVEAEGVALPRLRLRRRWRSAPANACPSTVTPRGLRPCGDHTPALSPSLWRMGGKGRSPPVAA
jgi:hypothetical protein